ncbi:MAG: RecX family transcriptional regulator [Oscillospiraceae bacterium]|nr:RecX family transcriptional regulator [Oscillospiraceae bacterium]
MTNETAAFAALMNRAAAILARREHSRFELRQKLLRPRKAVTAPPSEALTDAVLDRLEELDLLNDVRFAALLAAELGQRKGLGRAGILQELRHRGVDAALLATLPLPEEDAAQLTRLLHEKYAAKCADERGRRSVYQALLRRGFRHRDIQAAMRTALEDFAPENCAFNPTYTE